MLLLNSMSSIIRRNFLAHTKKTNKIGVEDSNKNVVWFAKKNVISTMHHTKRPKK